jgi:hypothetical protein
MTEQERKELIEKMARYIACASSSEDDPESDWCYDNWPAHENQARAALVAAEPVIREQADNALREENARLREALKPFAEMLKGNYSHQSDNMPIKAGANQYDLVFVFTLGDLRKAAAAIREGGKDE